MDSTSTGLLFGSPEALTNIDKTTEGHLSPYKGLLAADAFLPPSKQSVIKLSGPSDLLANLEGPLSTNIFSNATDLNALTKNNISTEAIVGNGPSQPNPFGATDLNAVVANNLSLGGGTGGTAVASNADTGTDYRVRIRAGSSASQVEQVLGKNDPTSNILSILYETNGLMFPYTPTIAVSQSVNWDPMSLVGTNFDVLSYQRTPSVTISVTGIFTTQNQREGEYLMAVIHFLRVVTKSYYGVTDAKKGLAGVPPPVLYFEGHGNFIFNKIPCVIKSYSFSFEEGIDSNVFTARMTSLKARLPAKMSIQMELGVQINPDKQKNIFSLDSFRSGKNLEFF